MKEQPSAIDQVFRHWDPMWRGKPHEIVKLAPTVVNIQNVAAYSEMMTYEKRQIPRIGRCFSPWELCLLYWSEPTTDAGIAYKLVLACQAKPDPDGNVYIGMIFMQKESKGASITILSGMVAILIPKEGLLEEDEDGSQVMRMSISGDPRTPLDHPAFSGLRAVAERMTSPLHVEALFVAGAARASWRTDTQKDLQVVLCAFSFANCRNVQVVEHGRTAPPPRWREQGVPSVKYRVVKIDSRPVTKYATSSIETSGRHMSLHVCRGHFKTFTAEKPLLGKHVGTYWWPQTTRGSAEHGVVEKSYKVEP